MPGPHEVVESKITTSLWNNLCNVARSKIDLQKKMVITFPASVKLSPNDKNFYLSSVACDQSFKRLSDNDPLQYCRNSLVISESFGGSTERLRGPQVLHSCSRQLSLVELFSLPLLCLSWALTFQHCDLFFFGTLQHVYLLSALLYQSSACTLPSPTYILFSFIPLINSSLCIFFTLLNLWLFFYTSSSLFLPLTWGFSIECRRSSSRKHRTSPLYLAPSCKP